MLSVENPPPDPPYPCEISQLKTTACSDETASHTLPLPDVDLFSSSHLPKFSIRDYVFTARSKDIKTNWPFSQRNLQLCLKHGVKDLLPPFQSVDSVRNQSLASCAVETSLLIDKENSSNSDGETSVRSLHSVPTSSHDAVSNHKKKKKKKLADVSSSRSRGDTDCPSTTTSNSPSEIESVIPSVETGTWLEAEAVGGPSPAPSSPKPENSTQPSTTKKCRLIVKLSPLSDPSSTEDIASNCTTLSEAMTSKICPVCKTFSSSSNTTLNAHIDQCLSGESTSKWMPDSKLTTKYKIKPRKTRSMVDICATAPRCTLEELDRRNGSSWATDLSLPPQVTEACGQGKKQRVSPVYPEAAGDEGAVYIDANGTKLRILSKLSAASSPSQLGAEPAPRKPFKGGKRSKFFSANKKKRHAPKHHKYLKLDPQSKKFCSPMAPSTEMYGGQDEYYGLEESCNKEQRCTPLSSAQGQIETSDSGSLRPWVCSKRTGLSKKINAKGSRQLLGCKFHATKDLLVGSKQSCSGVPQMEVSHVQKFPDLLENPVSSPESGKKMESSQCESQVNENRRRSPGRKRVRSPLLGARISGIAERSLEPPKRNSFHVSKDNTSLHDSCNPTTSNYTKGHASLLRDKMLEIHANAVKNSCGTPTVNSNLARGCHAFSSKPMRISPSRKNMLIVGQSSLPASELDANKRCSVLKKSQVHCMEEPDEQYDLIQKFTEDQSGTGEIIGKASLGMSSVRLIRQEMDESIALKSSQLATECHDHDMEEKLDSFVRGNDEFSGKFDDLEKEVQFQQEDIIIEQSSKTVVGESAMSLSKSIEPEFYRMDSSPDAQSDSLQSIEEYSGPFCGVDSPEGPIDPGLGNGQAMFSADEVGHGIIGQSTHLEPELDSKAGQENSFPEIDPIPIPGPPGSFLPSPGDMGSEDFQGNSSITTSRVHSLQDQHDFVDGDSSNSPISATSTISNSTAERTDLKYSEQLTAGPYAFQDKTRSAFSGASIEPLLENGAAVPQTAGMGADRIILGKGSLRTNVILAERGHPKFKDDDQPCCCSRKERSTQVAASNYEESQLLRRRTMASLTLPAMGKQIGCYQNARPCNLNGRPEMFSLSNCPSSGCEEGVFPLIKSPPAPIPMKGSTDNAIKFASRGLRLMGKNLMVVNKDDDSPVQFSQAELGAPSKRPSLQFPDLSAVPAGNNQNQDCHSFCQMVPQGSVNFAQDPRTVSETEVGHCYDVRLSSSFRNQINSLTPPTPAEAQAGMTPRKRTPGRLTVPLELQEHKDEHNLLTHQSTPKNRLDAASTYDIEKAVTTPDPQRMNSGSASNAVKEIIIIDDAPESEADSTIDDFKFTEGLRGSQASSASISIPTAPVNSSRHVNPSFFGHLPRVHQASFYVCPSRQANTSPAKWSCTSDGPAVLHQGSFMASSSSTSHLRPVLYYSPSLS